MTTYQLKLTLLSDTTFGRGDGVAGLVDVEVQHDAVGLPYLGGRALKGVLGAECEDFIYALDKAIPDQVTPWQHAALRLFGQSGARLTGAAIMRVGPARLPDDLQAALARDIEQKTLTRTEVLDMLTALRRQTALDESGAPRKETLRTLRVILRDTTFTSQLTFRTDPTSDDLALLATTVKALRRVGTGRNRGRGRVQAALLTAPGEDITGTHVAAFREAVQA
jgi:CRISPR/Cas system CSM-associated protein Csm3 (group 7 of RAMP superfamily)